MSERQFGCAGAGWAAVFCWVSGGGAGDSTQKKRIHTSVPIRHPINAEIIAFLRFRSFAILEFQHQIIAHHLDEGTAAARQIAE